MSTISERLHRGSTARRYLRFTPLRIAIVDTYYPAVLKQLYAEHPDLAAAPYEAQIGEIMGLCFGTADAYSRHLRELGHDAVEFVANCRPLQVRWAVENRVGRLLRNLPVPAQSRPDRAVWSRLSRAIVVAQLDVFDPDVVYVQDFNALEAADIAHLRRPGRLFVGQLGSAPPWERLPAYDLILTSFPHFVERVRARGVACEYFAIGFYERVAEILAREGFASDPSSAARTVPIAFVGGVHSRGVHRAGVALFERLCTELDLQMWGYVADDVSADSPIRRRHRGEAWGLDMYRVLARSRIIVNRHGDIAEHYANNMRLFEVTGMGALLLTESAHNLSSLFTPGVEVVPYDGCDDLIARARYFVAANDERRRIAAAGRARTLTDHTYAQRMMQLVEILSQRLR